VTQTVSLMGGVKEVPGRVCQFCVIVSKH
jgi:hypothetical protein